MVSSAHNPNKAEIPERRKDSTSTPVRGTQPWWLVAVTSVYQLSLALTNCDWSSLAIPGSAPLKL
ncbi:hypothetical protein P7K49_034588 [Saguinus oedipus]|uniref:Uncharacterized protein n=1 Tax=Saguinus oedipus TaxID=9490 RepID=A0ABQ9TV47_SAGOE|nr:hypothetical protein P7K49_034588 [Saguinus oedipus]